jgi:sortase A
VVLLRVGAVMMALALALAVGAALMMTFRAEPERQAAPVEPVAAEVPPEPGEKKETEDPEPSRKVSEGTPTPGQGSASEQRASPERRPAPEQRAAPEQPEPNGEPRPEPRQTALQAGEGDWTAPSDEELDVIDEPRHFAPDPNAALTLTVPSLGVYGAPVLDSDAPWALASGVVHVPETSMPWDEGAQRNVYLAAHRLGLPDAASRLLFYNLDDLGSGDEVILKGQGETYRYRVSETFEVGPAASWVMGQVRGRDMVTLQTCTPIPTFEKRLIVRADRV